MDYSEIEEHKLAGTCGTDGHKWAKALMDYKKKNNFEIDEELMIGWFCNAIEQARPAQLTEEDALGIAARIWCRPEAGHIEMDTVLATAFADVLVNGEPN